MCVHQPGCKRNSRANQALPRQATLQCAMLCVCSTLSLPLGCPSVVSQILHPGNIDQAATEPVYWRGYFWQCKLGMSLGGATVVSISAGCSADLARFAGYAAGAFPYQTQVSGGIAVVQTGFGVAGRQPMAGDRRMCRPLLFRCRLCAGGSPGAAAPLFLCLQAIYRIRLQSNGSWQDSVDPLQGTGVFSPAAVFNRGACHELKSTTWERFWAADSPFVRDGRVAVELTLSAPPS